MYNFDRKKFCGKFELSLEFGFSIWLLVTTADINKPDLSSWIYLYLFMPKREASILMFLCNF